MTLNWKPIRWNLRRKIILHVFVIGFIATILLAVLYITTQKNIIDTLNRQKSDIVAAMIECNIKQHMQEGRAADVTTALQRLAKSGNIRMIRILSLEGKILNSSKSAEIGSSIDDSAKAMLRSLYADMDVEVSFPVRPVSPSLSYLAIQNREECFRCHSSENAINGILEIAIEEEVTTVLLHQYQLKGVIIAFAALIIMTLIIYRLFERIINRPISVLKDNMRKVQNGNLSVRLNPLKNDEIGDLTMSFNIMVSNLKKARQEIEALHQKEMERAGHLASMGMLAAGLAHEIKNPIAGIKGALEVIIQRTEPKDPQKEIFMEILKQTDRIYHIVQDLLHYAKPKETELKRSNPREFIRAAILLAESQTQNKDIRIHFDDRIDENRILCDENKMQEVMLNLLVNAIAAIERSGDISVRACREEPELLVISVADKGNGIKKEHLDQVFNPFFTTRRLGTGLGLSICRRIVEEHKGTIDVESQEGKGTIFTIRLPLDKKESGT